MVLLAPEKMHSSSENIAGIDNKSIALDESIGYFLH